MHSSGNGLAHGERGGDYTGGQQHHGMNRPQRTHLPGPQCFVMTKFYGWPIQVDPH
jgi:hypothetical protein